MTTEVTGGPLRTLGGRPRVRARVTVAAVAPINPALRDSDVRVLSQVTVMTGPDGTWSVDLLPSSAQPAPGAHYRATWIGGELRFAVPDGPGPYRADALADGQPDVEPDLAAVIPVGGVDPGRRSAHTPADGGRTPTRRRET